MLRLSVILGRPDLGMPDWRSASETRAMTEAEIADVVAWMVSARVPVPVPEGPGPRAAARR
jgi:hypothetical protein